MKWEDEITVLEVQLDSLNREQKDLAAEIENVQKWIDQTRNRLSELKKTSNQMVRLK